MSSNGDGRASKMFSTIRWNVEYSKGLWDTSTEIYNKQNKRYTDYWIGTAIPK